MATVRVNKLYGEPDWHTDAGTSYDKNTGKLYIWKALGPGSRKGHPENILAVYNVKELHTKKTTGKKMCDIYPDKKQKYY